MPNGYDRLKTLLDSTKDEDEEEEETTATGSSTKKSGKARLDALLSRTEGDDTPANARSKAAYEELMTTGSSTYRGKDYTMDLPAEPTPSSSRADTLPELQRAIEAGEMHPTEALSRYLGTLNNGPAQGIQENHALTPALQAEFVRRNSGQATGTNFAPNVNLQYQMAQMANRGRAEGTNEEEVAGWVNSKAAPYQGIRNNKDYLANTKADEKYAIKGLYTATGKKAKYNYITNLNGFADSAKKSRENELSKYDFMTDNERKDYTYIANTQGLDAAEGYLDYLDYDLNARASEAAQAAWAKNAQGTGNAIGASATSVLANSVSGLGTLNLLGQNINKAFTGKPVDYNAPALNASKYMQTVRGQVAKDIEKAHPNATVAGVNLGSFLYQTGMSMADSAVVALLGSLGVPNPGIILGSSAAVNATLNAKERGLTDAQALTTGLASGIAEMLFEEISLEKIIHPTTAKSVGGVFKNILRQAFTEGSEEVATTLANTLTDALINGDKSEILTRQRELQADGMNEEEARKAAWKEWWIGLATDALGGALSGGLMGTGANVSNYVSEANYRQTGDAYKQLGMTNDELRDALVNVNQNTYDPYTREWLGKLTDRAARGEDLMKKLPSAEVGKVMALQAGLTNTVLTQTEYNRIARLNESPYNNVTDKAPQNAQEAQRAARAEDVPLPARAENAAETQGRTLTLPTAEEAPAQNTQQTLTMPTAAERGEIKTQVDEDLLWTTPKQNDGWKTEYNGDIPVLDALRIVNPEIASLMETESESGETDTPVMGAYLAAWEDVRQGTISPMAAATLLDRAYNRGGANALRELYNPETGNLYDPVLAQAKAIDAQRPSGETLTLPTVAEAARQQNAPQTLTLPTVAERQEQNAPQALTLPTVNSRTAETEEQMIERLKKSPAGLSQDEYTATMDQRTVKLLDTLAKKLGLRVAFADEVNRGKANADITGNVVLIEKGNPNPVRFLIGHEATHWMKRNADGGYNAFEKAARKADSVWFQNREAEIRQAYQKQGISIDEAGIREEAIADYAGLLADNSDTLERFITENKDDRSALEKVRDFFRHVKAFLTGDERAKVERAERRLIQALQQTERTVASGEGARQGNNTQQSLKSNIDGTQAAGYNNELTGGVQNGRAQEGTAGAELDGTSGEGVSERRVRAARGDRAEGRALRQGDISVSGIVQLSESSKQLLNDRSVGTVEMEYSTDHAAFSALLDEARTVDKENGWAVTPKTVEALENCRTFLSEDRGVGFALAPNGDIEAVFRNRNRHPQGRAMRSVIPQAIANGGTKLDCYGPQLARVYADAAGMVPVCRVTFDPGFANPGWTPDKGQPDVVFMMVTDTDADTIIQKQGTYHIPTDEEITELPLFTGETGYDDAAAYRDRLLEERLRAGNTEEETKRSLKESDSAYLSAVNSGDMATAQRMVDEAAKIAGFVDAIPEQTSTYAVRTGRPPKNTVKVYKVFTVTDDGSPTALFVSGTEKLPQNVWLNAQDTWHFTAKNGLQYVPSTQNPYTDGGKTGGQVEIPNDEIRQELIRRGFLPKGSKAKAITALAYRPGWHAGDLPFFPQGGMQIEGSNYKNVHRYNQVVFECEMDADTDYTTYHTNKDGKTVFHDMETMPDGGYYKFSTNPMANAQDIGSWYISGSLKIGRALTEAECNKLLQDSGRPIQEWQQYQDKDARRNMSKEERDAYEHTMGPMNLAALGYTGERFDAARKTLAPVTYDDDGNIIPLSERFNPADMDIRYSLKDSDSAYLSAANSGDTETAQRMVEDAARAAGYNIRAYHGTSNYGFTRFNNYFTKFGLFGNGFYFTESPEVAESYTKKGKGTNPGVYSVFLKADKLIDMDAPADLSKWRKGFRDFDFDESYLDGVSTNEDAFRALKEAMQDAEMYQWEAEETVPDFIQEMGYDGITHMGGGRYGSKDGPSHRVYIVYDSSQIKSANPVTRTDIGEVIPLSERFNEENDDIRYSLKDSDYLSAVKSGDMETAQRMADEAAKAAGYTIKAYHGTTEDFTKFSRGKQGQNHDGYLEFGAGFYFTPSENEAREWVSRGKSGRSGKAEPKVMAVYLAPDSIINADDPIPRGAESLQRMGLSKADANFIAGRTYRFINYLIEDKGFSNTEVQEELKSLGYSAIDSTYRNGATGQYVVFDPEQIKSADPVTYDKDGNIIPLSERFNPNNDDIRYSLKGLDADAIPESVRRYGRIQPGEKPARDIQVPKRVTEDKNERVSQTIRTVLEAGATPDTAVPTISELVEKGAYSYQVYSDKDAIAKAEDTIKDKGWEATLTEWVKDVSDGTVNKTNTALGWALYNNAANEGDLDTALNVLDLIVRHQRNAAQAVQATRILKQLTPEAQLYGVQRSVDNLIAEIKQKYGKNVDIQVNRDLARAFLNAKTEEERRKALEALYKDVGRQLPSRFVDKWNAWRYLAMLGNPRTHVRNIVGNAGFAPVVLVKDQVGTMLESIVYRLSNGKTERTKGLVLPGWDHKLVKAAWDRYDDIMDEALGGGKYTDVKAANDAIQQGRVIFKFKPLEWARRGNSAALDKEDIWFNKPHYVYAMAQYCKANDITPAQIASGKGLEKAEAYAIKEAQKATYRDINAFSNFVSNIGRSTDRKTPVGKVASAVIEGILPFRRTPANILARGVEYSPLGLAKSLTYDMYQVMKKDADGNPRMTVSEMLDNVSAGLTGTGLLALGMLLSKLGLLRGHGEDDEKARNFDDLTGHQNYALQLPNGDSYTLDWLAPEALPVFVGVNLYERMLKTKGEMKMNDLLKAISSISEPMLEMSMIQGINDLLETVSFAKNNETSALFGVLSEATISYLTQAFPTLLGQSERTGENVRMTTYTDKNKWLMPDLQYSLGKVSAKTPGWDYDQIPYIDAWGRTEVTGDGWLERAFKNMLNPGYTDKVRMSDMEKELLRLYNVNPEDNGGVLPTRAGRKIGDTDLTGEQYVKYATKKGELSYELVTGIIKSAAYKKATDSERVEMIKDAYDYANEKGRAAAIPGYKPSKNKDWMKEMDETVKATKVSRADYISARYAASQIKGIPDGEGGTVTNSAGLKKMDYLYGLTNLTQTQREAMMADFGVSETLLESVQSKDDVNGMLEFIDAGIPATEYKDYKIASGVRGIDLNTYMKGYNAYYDADGSGTKTNADWTAVLDKQTFSKDKAQDSYIKGVLWQLYTNSTSTKNNPYDKSGGQYVLDEKDKAKGGGSGSGQYARANIPTLKLPTVESVPKRSTGRLELPTI